MTSLNVKEQFLNTWTRIFWRFSLFFIFDVCVINFIPLHFIGQLEKAYHRASLPLFVQILNIILSVSCAMLKWQIKNLIIIILVFFIGMLQVGYSLGCNQCVFTKNVAFSDLVLMKHTHTSVLLSFTFSPEHSSYFPIFSSFFLRSFNDFFLLFVEADDVSSGQVWMVL